MENPDLEKLSSEMKLLTDFFFFLSICRNSSGRSNEMAERCWIPTICSNVSRYAVMNSLKDYFSLLYCT